VTVVVPLGHDVPMILLVPGDVLRPRRVDAHFAAEATAAQVAGLTVALVDHDALTRPDGARQAVAHLAGDDNAIYRGWMLRAEQYAAFATALTDRGIRLTTTPEQYRRAHELPGWYPALADLTPASTWTVGTDRDDFDAARHRLGPGPAVLRDYCKSMKHHWHEATVIPDLTDAAAAWAVASRFHQLRAEDLVGGFVLRRFETFTGAEVRTWWVNGVCRLITAHPDTPDDLPPPEVDLTPLTPVLTGLGLPLVTVDLARHTDGRWRVVELGDGQVSDRPTSTPADTLITALCPT
jgi:ATP-grasp domain, R2K clade family 3